MKPFAISSLRLLNQRLATPTFKTPADAVHWFGAVQAQDYMGSLWAVGQRMQHATEKTIEQALADRTIVRSWPMRGTLHFTHAQDLRWMLKLLAPRIIKKNAFRYKELELSDDVIKKSEKILINALIGGKQKTRDELYSILDENGVDTSGQRGIHILGLLAMEGVLCFGVKEGKQFTFTLLDEWLPASKQYETDEAIAELTKRYFTSHGPATIKDFAWWSGLTIKEATTGLEMVKSHFVHETIDGERYWFVPHKKMESQKQHRAFLLPMYDELLVAYKNRTAIVKTEHMTKTGNGIFKPVIVLDDVVIGTWTRELKKHEVIVKPHLFRMLTKPERDAIKDAALRYGKFLNRTVKLL